MTVAQEPVPALLWHEGMMLAPQHFQQLVQRQEQAVHYHTAVANPFHWGVVELTLDPVMLVTGTARVVSLEAVLPDGMIYRYDPRRDRVLEKSLQPYAEAASRAPVTLHLTVPVGRAVEGSGGGDLPRFSRYEAEPLQDEAGQAEPIAADRLRVNADLDVTALAGQQPPAKFISVPIARISYENESFILSPAYVPPGLMVRETAPLGRLVADVARRAREKALFLAGRVAAAEAGGQPVPVETRAEIQGLAAGLPSLEALLGIGRAHPFALYLELARFAGLVSAFAAGNVPPLFSRYDHNDPLPAFTEIRDIITRTLDRVRETARPVAFVADGPKFTLQLEKGWTATGRLLIGVRGPVGMAEAEITAWIDACLIATRDRSENLWGLRVLGAARRPLDRSADLDFTPPRGSVLFAIEADAASITPGDVLEIWSSDTRPGRLRPTDISLYVSG